MRNLQPPAQITLTTTGNRLHITITGHTDTHPQLDTLRDRLDAVDGTVTIRTCQSRTLVELTVPVRAPIGASS